MVVEANAAGADARKRHYGDAPDTPADTKRTDVHGLVDAAPSNEAKRYCVCRTELEDDRVMIACDHCDEWFHASCLHIDDDAVERIDQFICPSCETRTDARTSYKQPCKSPGCTNAARLPVSLYCSDECGMRTVRERVLALEKTPNAAARLTTDAVRTAHHPRGYAVWTRPTLAQGASTQESAHAWFARMQEGIRTLAPIAGPPPGTSVGAYARAHATALDGKQEHAQWAAELARLRAESASGNVLLDVLAVRGKLLQLAEDRLSALPPATVDDTSKNRDASIPRCGFDARLAWDDEPLWAWATSSTGRAILQEEIPLDGRFAGQQDGTGPEVVCGEPKRRCKRHADWSIVRGADTEVARELQTLHVSSLAEREQDLRAWLDTPT